MLNYPFAVSGIIIYFRVDKQVLAYLDSDAGPLQFVIS